jgi:SAM-dependent methyltransferase
MEPRAGPANAAAAEARLRDLLPPALLEVFNASFIRSNLLFDEFVFRLVLQVLRQAGIDTALRVPAGTEEIAVRARVDRARGLAPLDWMLRHLAGRGVIDADGKGRFQARSALPELDPAPVREEQLRHDPSALPSYVLAETVALDYGAFLRGEVAGEDVLFAPRRLRLWMDYFSNDNVLYAVNNRVGAVALEQWLPAQGGSVLELGGGLGSGALAVLERLTRAGRLSGLREYRFTEFVPAFLRRGQQALQTRYPDLKVLAFGALDMNRPFVEQGIQPGSLAAVYAVNTLHVAHDLAFTLGEVREALQPGGRLVVAECVRPQPRATVYAEFIFNLMETFRSPRLHPVYRPGGGFLTPEQWQGAVEAAGLQEVRFLPDISKILVEVPEFVVAALGATRAS